MSDLAQWNVQGPVETLRTEHAEWDLTKEDWKPARHSGVVRFRRDEPITNIVAMYDDSGRLVRRGEFAIEGLDIGFFGVTSATTITTSCDEQDRPVEVLAHDASHGLLRRITITRDDSGRVVKAELFVVEELLFPDTEGNASPADRERLKAAIGNMFGPNQAMSTVTYAYDEKGRRVERIVRMGELGGDRTTFHFDDHDNPVEEITEHTSREMQIDEQGNLHPSSESSHQQRSRLEYKYDAQGNWTERVVWGKLEPNSNFQRSNIERREIRYHDG